MAFFKVTNNETGVIRKVKKPFDVYDCVEDIVGMELCEVSQVPYAIEAESWAELACIGDTFEYEKFTVEVIDN